MVINERQNDWVSVNAERKDCTWNTVVTSVNAHYYDRHTLFKI